MMSDGSVHEAICGEVTGHNIKLGALVEINTDMVDSPFHKMRMYVVNRYYDLHSEEPFYSLGRRDQILESDDKYPMVLDKRGFIVNSVLESELTVIE